MRRPTLEQIELLNAHGPYNHAVWTNGSMTLSHEEALAGRGRFLADTLRRVLLERFGAARLASMSILDVGCYDGWILHEISDLPLRRLVGLEPRPKNIRKGEVAREVFGIRTRVEFREGGLDTLSAALNGERFDIVMCTGVLHHVESPAEALRAMRAVCREMLFAETIALDSRHLGEAARREIEPKDVAYHGRARVAGLSGQKLESSYYDGSATGGLRVVSIPSFETLSLCCEAAGFGPPRLAVDPAEYRRAVWRDRRPFHAVIFTADAAVRPEEDPGGEYERRMAAAVIPRADLEPLHRLHCAGARRAVHTPVSRAVHALIRRRGAGPARLALEGLVSGAALEILGAIPHAPADKIAVEMGKALLAEGDLDGAEREFLTVTRRWNADWRSVYRAFHGLACIAGRRGDAAGERRYRDLLAAANPGHPALAA